MTPAQPLAFQHAVRSERDDASRLREQTSGAQVGTPRVAACRVLVISQRFDPHADVVVAALERRGAAAVRVNTDDLHGYAVRWDSETGGIVIRGAAGLCVDMHDVRSCYFRPSATPSTHPDLEVPGAAAFSAQEADAFVQGLYALPGVRWISPPHLVERAAAKVGQLAVAKQVGLTVPRTVVTNDPAEARAFAASIDGDIVVKALGATSVEAGAYRFAVAAQRLSSTELMEHADAVRLAPTVLQEHIAKDSEVRVTVIGEDVFAVELTSLGDDAPVDWTRVDPSRLAYAPVSLSHALEERIRAFLAWYQLPFGALDFLRLGDGNLAFMENNPNGAWYWLELATGLPLAESMGRLLTGGDT